MFSITIIFICILILDILIHKKLPKKLNIQVQEKGYSYVNTFHKYGERILYLVMIFVFVILVAENLTQFYFLIFICPALMFGFRTYIEWKFIRNSKKYILSALTFGLFLLGLAVYGFIQNI